MAVMLAGGAVMGVILSIIHPIFYNVGTGNIFGLLGTYAGGTNENLIAGIGTALFAVLLGAAAVILFAKYNENMDAE